MGVRSGDVCGGFFWQAKTNVTRGSSRGAMRTYWRGQLGSLRKRGREKQASDLKPEIEERKLDLTMNFCYCSRLGEWGPDAKPREGGERGPRQKCSVEVWCTTSSTSTGRERYASLEKRTLCVPSIHSSLYVVMSRVEVLSK